MSAKLKHSFQINQFPATRTIFLVILQRFVIFYLNTYPILPTYLVSVKPNVDLVHVGLILRIPVNK